LNPAIVRIGRRTPPGALKGRAKAVKHVDEALEELRLALQSDKN